jgi:hypothetical protein
MTIDCDGSRSHPGASDDGLVTAHTQSRQLGIDTHAVSRYLKVLREKNLDMAL